MRASLLVVLFLTATVFAQPDRYELGRRLHDFEVAWDEKAGDTAARKRAAPIINQAVQQVLKLNLPAAAEAIDKARHALASNAPAASVVRWADALQVVPETRMVDAATEHIDLIVKAFYKVDGEAPKDAGVRVKLGAGKPVEAKFETLPATVKVPVKVVPGTPSADFPLLVEILVDGKTVARKETRIARVEKMIERIAAIKKAAADVPNPPTTVEEATQLLLVKQIEALARKGTPETDYPGSRLVFGAERLGKISEPYYISSRPGEFWLSFPTDKTASIVRIRIPPKLDDKKPVPIVFALHGMGGSENLYFDAYGNGIVPRLATERGWIVVAPRVEGLLGAGPAPKVPEILDELVKRYPIDIKRIYLVGHSMGAGHALQLAQKDPGRYAAIAVLGGSRVVPEPEKLRSTRFFVGCGKLDSALKGAQDLHKALNDANVPATLQEYDDIEHLLIVRASANDVFKFFEEK